MSNVAKGVLFLASVAITLPGLASHWFVAKLYIDSRIAPDVSWKKSLRSPFVKVTAAIDVSSIMLWIVGLVIEVLDQTFSDAAMIRDYATYVSHT